MRTTFAPILLTTLLVVLLSQPTTEAFHLNTPQFAAGGRKHSLFTSSSPSQRGRNVVLVSSSSSTNAITSESDGGYSGNQAGLMGSSTLNGITPNGAVDDATAMQQQQQVKPQQLNYRAQSGPFSFKVGKYGVLNLYGIWYGLVAIGFGLPWLAALTMYQFFTIVTRGKFDKQRFIPTLFNHIWGTLLMRFTRSYPRVEGLGILKDFYAKYVFCDALCCCCSSSSCCSSCMYVFRS